uniref:Uncharacterized protein n=1 Tax=Heterorhabditis bacteriophora TaxID=37862 RepID=A0A1I7X3D2_HETBA
MLYEDTLTYNQWHIISKEMLKRKSSDGCSSRRLQQPVTTIGTSLNSCFNHIPHTSG